MKTFLTVIAGGFLLAIFSVAGSGFAQELEAPTPTKTNAVPVRIILSEDIVQDSIKLFRFPTNGFAVRFTYTEAGAKKMLAFRKAHDGQEIMTKVGSFESRSTIWPRAADPAGWTDEGWLRRRTDKIICAREEDAKKLVAGLKGKIP